MAAGPEFNSLTSGRGKRGSDRDEKEGAGLNRGPRVGILEAVNIEITNVRLSSDLQGVHRDVGSLFQHTLALSLAQMSSVLGVLARREDWYDWVETGSHVATADYYVAEDDSELSLLLPLHRCRD